METGWKYLISKYNTDNLYILLTKSIIPAFLIMHLSCVVQIRSVVLHFNPTAKHLYYCVICDRSAHFPAGHHPLM